MRKHLRSYFSFNKAERLGFAGLLFILLAFIGIRLSLPYMTSHTELRAEKVLPKTQESATTSTKDGKDTVATQMHTTQEPPIIPELFHFDPNKLDSTGFRKLGLKAKTVSILLNWRKKGKVFRKKEDLRSLYTLTPEEYDRLQPYISIQTNAKRINLNLADSATLVALYGIGPRLAHKIIAYRNEHGKFLYIEQLFEIHRFPDSTYTLLKEQLYID